MLKLYCWIHESSSKQMLTILNEEDRTDSMTFLISSFENNKQLKMHMHKLLTITGNY